MYDPSPTICPICAGKVIYTPMKAVGIKPFESGKCYYCTSCKAFVSTHRNKPQYALGVLADGKTRKMRIICHKEFDKHWQSTRGKNLFYFMLAKTLKIKKDDCHFGYMTFQELNNALNVMQNELKDVYIK